MVLEVVSLLYHSSPGCETVVSSRFMVLMCCMVVVEGVDLLYRRGGGYKFFVGWELRK